jgi:large subunit ribosomal protein L9
MHVSLLEDINALGPKGATVDVPEGYALNFLFPQHLAVKVANSVATDKEEAKRLKSMKHEAISPEQELAGEIDGLEVVVQAQMKKGKMAAPVTATEIRAALKELGYKVSKSAIKAEPITSLGSQDVPINFDSGFEATIKVVVESGP